MDKNVSSVNLDELKAARESLDRERGVETDPNMYNDYDPEKHKAEREQEKLARENASNNDDTDVSLNDSNEESIAVSAEPTLESNNDINIDFSGSDDDEIIIDQSSESTETVDSFEPAQTNVSQENQEEQDGETNLNIYDTFADFEVNSGNPEDIATDDNQNDKIEDTDGPKVERVKFDEPKEEDSGEIDSSSLDDFLKDLDAILSSDSADDEKIVADEEISVENEAISESSNDLDESSAKPDFESEEISTVDDEQIVVNEKADDVIESKTEENIEKEDVVENDLEEVTSNKADTDDIFAFSNYENLVDEEPTMNNNVESEYNTEILSDFSKISNLADEMEAEMNEAIQIENAKSEEKAEITETEEIEEDEQVEPESVYPKIEPFNFIDVISTDEFKDEDKFSYLLGKDEENKLVFGHLKDTCGTAVFTRNEDAVFSGFSSILLSLLLKNTPDEMQFVVCDAMFDSEFDVFENSSYMYFNRVAKNNREIVDTLIELSKEIETRYNNLVYAGVKSISAYNLQAEERGSGKMPYVVVFVNNYAKISQFLDNERINTCIYNLLKFGRIVGVYVMLASAGEIERREINYNLPTRIAYKTEEEIDSVRAIGSEGAESLTDENDFLYSTIYDEEVKHLKVANLTKKEIELVIENLEN